MNNSDCNTNDNNRRLTIISTWIGVTYIALSMLFLAVYPIANLAIWKDKQLWDLICYKFIFCYNSAAAITTFSFAISGIFEFIDVDNVAEVSRIVYVPIIWVGASMPGYYIGLAVFRMAGFMELVPEIWLQGKRGNLIISIPAIYATAYITVYICMGYPTVYVKVAHIPLSAAWVDRYNEIVSFGAQAISTICHSIFVTKLLLTRAAMSAEAKRSIGLKFGYQIPFLMTAGQFVTILFLYVLLPLIPTEYFPGAVSMVFLILSIGSNGLLTLLYVKRIRQSALRILKRGEAVVVPIANASKNKRKRHIAVKQRV